MARRLRVLVLCGGQSAERQVSLVSAKTVLSNLDRRLYAPELVFIDPGGRWFKAKPELLTGKVEVRRRDIRAGRSPMAASRLLSATPGSYVVFPVLHGPMGEDGTIQGMLEFCGAAYVGCGVMGSAVGMDKEASKILAAQAGLPLLPYRVLRGLDGARDALRGLGLPLFVKPARLGSSVGVSKVKRPAELGAALKVAFRYDDKVILEKGIEAREIECAVLGDPWSRDPRDPLRRRASICGEIVPNAEFYTYRSKYLDPDGARLMIPADIPAPAARRIREMSLSAFKALDGYAMARADFLMDKKTGKAYFNEINTIPGFTSGSMYPLLWKASGMDTPELLHRLIQLALRRREGRARLKTAP